MQNNLSITEKKRNVFSFGISTSNNSKENLQPRPKKQEIIKLWQLDHNYHCAIIGTCLTLEEVKKILRQLHIETNGFPSYELHTSIVTIISENSFPSKKVQNYLNKKFKLDVQKTKKMTEDELKGFWKAALFGGDMIGAFWAVMIHPESGEAMKRTFFGDIHMLSHLSGSSNRADLKRLSQLEKERTEYNAKRHSWEGKCNKLASENSRLQNAAKHLHEQQSGLENHVTSLKNSLEQLMVLQSTKERQELDTLLEKQTIKLDCQANEIAKQQSKEKQLSKLISAQKHQISASHNELLAYQNELDYLQSALIEKPQAQCPLQRQNLCGQCVLYVGGKINLIPFYRELVEEKSGIFIHHDGGIEKNTQDLQQSLNKADVVVFPSSCISHDAYWKIKRACKKQQKPFQYLKSSGLYSLSSALDTITTEIEMPRINALE